jgi:hypothetical protein
MLTANGKIPKTQQIDTLLPSVGDIIVRCPWKLRLLDSFEACSFVDLGLRNANRAALSGMVS